MFGPVKIVSVSILMGRGWGRWDRSLSEVEVRVFLHPKVQEFSVGLTLF